MPCIPRWPGASASEGAPDDWIAEVEGDVRLGGEFRARFTSEWEVIEEQGMPLDHLAACGAGWQVHVEDLAAYLAGRERCDIRARRAELAPAYQGLAGCLAHVASN